MVKVRKVKSIVCNDEGSAIGLFVVIILSMTLLATASITLAQTQYSWARFSRQTSNSYHLARSGAEKTVDNMNKEVAKVLPDLMKKASENTHNKLIGTGTGTVTLDGVKYAGGDAYTGKYVGAEFDNEYERQLKELVYNHIVDKFITTPILTDTQKDYKAVKSDVKDPIEIEVKTKVYKYGDGLPNPYEGRDSILSAIGKLGTITEIKDTPETATAKDAFVVEVVALAKDITKSSITKSKVVGSISLDKMLRSEELLEAYEWADAYPETIQSAIISFGDFVINGEFEAKVEGDISVKGTTRASATAQEAKMGEFPEPGEFGGIVVSDGGNLEVDGNALVVNNIQTTNSEEPTQRIKTSKIKITKDAIAGSIAINDNASESNEPWKTLVENNKIEVGRNAYLDNDLRIARYVKNGEITVANSVFGISNGDSHGVADGTGIYVDPNKSSGVYAMGISGDNSKIKMGRAFIAGQAYINFGDGNGYHRLYESAGEPFEDVYYLDEYREAYGSKDTYIEDFKDAINKDRIEIVDSHAEKKHAYAPAFISEGVDIHDLASTGPTNASPIGTQAQALGVFYQGIIGGLTPELQGKLSSTHDWDSEMPGMTAKWGAVIENPGSFYNGANPFGKSYFENPTETVSYSDLLAYKGLQGYMLGKRGVFYKHFKKTTGTTGLLPVERKFEDLVKVGVFTTPHTWSRDNPITVVTGSSDIKLKDYKNKPTAIVCTDPSSTLTLKSTSGNREFTGIIITPGKIVIENEMTINGIVIAGNENTGATTPKRIREGDHAGIQIKTADQVLFKYDMGDAADRDMIWKMRFMDKSLQRQLYDCLGMTNYEGGGSTGDMDVIFGPSGQRKVTLSKKSVISSNQEGLQFVMKSLKKINK